MQRYCFDITATLEPDSLNNGAQTAIPGLRWQPVMSQVILFILIPKYVYICVRVGRGECTGVCACNSMCVWIACVSVNGPSTAVENTLRRQLPEPTCWSSYFFQAMESLYLLLDFLGGVTKHLFTPDKETYTSPPKWSHPSSSVDQWVYWIRIGVQTAQLARAFPSIRYCLCPWGEASENWVSGASWDL